MGVGGQSAGSSSGTLGGLVWMVAGIFVAVPSFYAADALKAKAEGLVSSVTSLREPESSSAAEQAPVVPSAPYPSEHAQGLSAFARANERGGAARVPTAGGTETSTDDWVDWTSELLLTAYGSGRAIPDQERAQVKKLWPLVTLRYGGAGSGQRVYDAAVRILEVSPYYSGLTPSKALEYLFNYNPADYGQTARSRVAELANVDVTDAAEDIYDNLRQLYSQSIAAAIEEQQARAEAIAANRDAARARGQANNAAVHQYMVNRAQEQSNMQATVRNKAYWDRQKAAAEVNRAPAVRVTPPMTVIPVR